MHPVVAMVLEAGLARLRDLKNEYSLEDMYNLFEMHCTGIRERRIAEQRELQSARLRAMAQRRA